MWSQKFKNKIRNIDNYVFQMLKNIKIGFKKNVKYMNN